MLYIYRILAKSNNQQESWYFPQNVFCTLCDDAGNVYDYGSDDTDDDVNDDVDDDVDDASMVGVQLIAHESTSGAK